MSQPPPCKPRSRLRKWGLRLLIVVVLCAGLYLFRAPLLRMVGGFLVVDEPAQEGDVVLLLGGDRDYDRAAEWQHDGFTSRILVLEGWPGRLERLQILDMAGVRAQKALAKRGVPEANLTVLSYAERGEWNGARRLRQWLEDNPDAKVAVLCDRMSSRRERLVYRIVLGDLLARVHWCALPHRDYDETNWWCSKVGLRAGFNGYLSLAHVCIYGEGRDEREWDPDQYEQTLPHQP